MNRIGSVISMHRKDAKIWLLLSWAILLSSFVVNLAIALIVRAGDFTTGGITSIFIYMLVAGIGVVRQTFPFSLGLCITRRDYYLGTAIAAIGYCFITAAGLAILTMIEKAGDGWWTGMHFFEIPYLSDSSPMAVMWIFFSLLLFMFFSGFLISSIGRRFGKRGVLLLFGGIMLVFGSWTSIVTMKEWWPAVGERLMGLHYTMLETTMLLLPVTLLFALASYLSLRRAVVQS